MLQEAKIFIAMFDELVSNISEEEINSYRNKLKKERIKIVLNLSNYQ